SFPIAAKSAIVSDSAPLMFSTSVCRNRLASAYAAAVAQARREPKGLTVGTPGNATPQHLATELLQAACGIDMLHVPYRGTGPMMTDLLGGQIQVVVATVAAVEPYLKSGRL
ncbi:hypothetical protein LLE87_29065, partial [Paenibacillus polymyxa]|nr:hypothetical protein [Paenibacillus polymyxa]